MWSVCLSTSIIFFLLIQNFLKYTKSTTYRFGEKDQDDLLLYKTFVWGESISGETATETFEYPDPARVLEYGERHETIHYIEAIDRLGTDSGSTVRMLRGGGPQTPRFRALISSRPGGSYFYQLRIWGQ